MWERGWLWIRLLKGCMERYIHAPHLNHIEHRTMLWSSMLMTVMMRLEVHVSDMTCCRSRHMTLPGHHLICNRCLILITIDFCLIIFYVYECWSGQQTSKQILSFTQLVKCFHFNWILKLRMRLAVWDAVCSIMIRNSPSLLWLWSTCWILAERSFSF